MERKPQKQARDVPAQQQYPRKIGFVARRLGDLKTAPTTKPEQKQTPHVISDWASI